MKRLLQDLPIPKFRRSSNLFAIKEVSLHINIGDHDDLTVWSDAYLPFRKNKNAYNDNVLLKGEHMSKIKKLFSRATGVADLEKIDELAQNSPNRDKIFATADKAVLKAIIYGWTMGMLTAATGAFIIATSPRTRKTQKMTNV